MCRNDCPSIATRRPWLIRLAALLATVTLASDSARAGDPAGLDIHRSRATGLASFVTPADGGIIPVQIPPGSARAEPVDFLLQYGDLFGLTDPQNQLVVARTETDALGYTHTTYHQVHAGLPVFSGVLKVHQDATGSVVAANGDFYPISPKLNTIPTLDAWTAEDIALADMNEGEPELVRSELVIVDPGWYGDRTIGAHLAYHIILADLRAGIEEAFFVDAHGGEILDRWSLIHTAKNRHIHAVVPGDSDCCTGHGTPGCSNSACATSVCSVDPYCCNVVWDEFCAWMAMNYCGSLCPDVYTLPGPPARFEGQSPTGEFDVDAAYDYYGDTYDYYYRGQDRDSINDGGMAMVATVNSPLPGCPNAYWDPYLQQMVFCPDLVSDDVVGHELTHGVTQFTAGLIYQNQSGQLNESFSDVFGELIDLFNGNAAFVGPPGGLDWPMEPDRVTGPGTDTPNDYRGSSCSGSGDSVRWLMGEDLTVVGGAIRDMWMPTCFGDPDRANSSLQECPWWDSGGVHIGSGIPNHAFAMLTDGKTFNGYTVSGIGPIKAGAVWYRALSQYLTVASDFEDAYHAFNQAAADLVGTAPADPRTGAPSASGFTAFDAQQVDRALLAVEMNGPGACGSGIDPFDLAAPVECDSQQVLVSYDFDSDDGGWTVSNTGPPTPYDWVRTASLPGSGGSGDAWFCKDLLSDCGSNGLDESAVHYLTSPAINLPAGLKFPTLTFRHYINSEIGFDGGNLRIKVNGQAWQLIPAAAFTHNTYNIQPLYLEQQGSNNPLAGESGFSGQGGGWASSVVHLSDFVSGGETVRLQFEFGKDYCWGIQAPYNGWYIDDVVVYQCPSSADCNTNGIPDEIEVSAGVATDCNTNTILDECELADGSASDCNTNGVPDECDPDCNNSGAPDECDIRVGTSNDCNSNQTPDECEADCNNSGFPDDCDLAAGTSQDVNTNGIPDECDECLFDADCDDTQFCNGPEPCLGGVCGPGADPCWGQFCDEAIDQCLSCLTDAHCDDITFCNGAERCDAGTCIDGDDPCPGLQCDEPNDVCRECWISSHCDDGLWCTGLETCDGDVCVAGAAPCQSGYTCDEASQTCSAPPVPECTTDSDCTDGSYCNGVERCSGGSCVDGTAPCSEQICEEVDERCVDCQSAGDCNDGVFCNGFETCDDQGTCQQGTAPCQQGQVCIEDQDRCIWCASDAECADELFCNGTEVCVDGSCVAGDDPCAGQLCEEDTDACVVCLEDADCDDGRFCNGREACVEAVCQPGDDPCPQEECCESDEACGVCPCTSDFDCGDGDPCTDDLCVGSTCVFQAIVGCGDPDLDGVGELLDRCPNTAEDAEVDERGCSCDQLDDDEDGVDDCDDLCPGSPATRQIDTNGCACNQLDDDGDGVDNCEDLCPATPGGEEADGHGCSFDQRDQDDDGVPNRDDLCPDTNPAATVSPDGCSAPQRTADEDDDGVVNILDHCLGTTAGATVDEMGCSAAQAITLGEEAGALAPDQEGTESADPERTTGGSSGSPGGLCGLLGALNVALLFAALAVLRISSRWTLTAGMTRSRGR